MICSCFVQQEGLLFLLLLFIPFWLHRNGAAQFCFFFSQTVMDFNAFSCSYWYRMTLNLAPVWAQVERLMFIGLVCGHADIWKVSTLLMLKDKLTVLFPILSVCVCYSFEPYISITLSFLCFWQLNLIFLVITMYKMVKHSTTLKPDSSRLENIK